MDWDSHAADWPHAASSRFALCKPHRWHIQEMGKGPLILLLHGAGGGTQSWCHLMPLLARGHKVVTVDLPGQGFTKNGAVQRLGLVPMAQDLRTLCQDQGWTPSVIIGHSAGGALALEMARYLSPAPRVIGINAALGNFRGPAGLLFPLIAKALYVTPFVARFFTASVARPASIDRLIDGTGSKLPPDDIRWYRAMISSESHVDATLGMMAQWNLNPLIDALPNHPSPTLLIASSGDKTVPASISEKVAAQLPKGQFLGLEGYGHLVHEEAPKAVLDAILPFANSS
ncbi:MAG: alpha/beta fold hydrolase BchO [Pseudomonadota bacterium]